MLLKIHIKYNNGRAAEFTTSTDQICGPLADGDSLYLQDEFKVNLNEVKEILVKPLGKQLIFDSQTQPEQA